MVEDASQVIPAEPPQDCHHVPRPLCMGEEKEVVPCSQDPQAAPLERLGSEESGLQLTLGYEDKETTAGLNPEILEEDRNMVITHRFIGRGRLKCIFILFFIIVLTIVAAVSLVNIIQHSQSTTIPVAAASSTANPTTSISNAPPSPTISSTSNSSSSQWSPTPLTGIAIIYPENGDIVWLLYQDISGSVRLVRYTSSGIWQSNQSLPMTNVANQSPLTTVSYHSPSGEAIVTRLFYVDVAGILRDIISVGSAGPWTPGTLGNYNFEAPIVGSVGMLGVVSYGTPFFSKRSNTANTTIPGVLSLFVGGMDGLVHEYNSYLQNDTWSTGYVFPGTNGYSDISVYTVQNMSLLLMFNKNGVLSQWIPCASQGLCTEQPWITGQTYNLTAFSNTSLSSPIDGFSYYQGSDMSIDFISLSSSVSGDVTGDPLGMQSTSIAGGLFSTGGVKPPVGHVFFQSPNGSITFYGEGTSTGLSTVWENLGQVPLG